MEKVDEILRGFALAGIQAVALVPKYVVDSKTRFVVTYRVAGELYTTCTTYAGHMLLLAGLTR
jgi:hypothetical protein